MAMTPVEEQVRGLRRLVQDRVADTLSRTAVENKYVAPFYWRVRSHRKGALRVKLERSALRNERIAEVYWRRRKEFREPGWAQRRRMSQAD
jgi:hypothetical protein